VCCTQDREAQVGRKNLPHAVRLKNDMGLRPQPGGKLGDALPKFLL